MAKKITDELKLERIQEIIALVNNEKLNISCALERIEEIVKWII